MASTTFSTSSPALDAKSRPSASAWHRPTTQIWFVILVSCPAPGPPIRLIRDAYDPTTGSALVKAPSSPPTITVRTPFRAPSTPPETGASRKYASAAETLALTVRASRAETVEWSTQTAPVAMVGTSSSATTCNSWSAGREVMMNSAPVTADVTESATSPLFSSAHLLARPSTTSNTTSSSTAALSDRWAARCQPMRPRPRTAILTLVLRDHPDRPG